MKLDASMKLKWLTAQNLGTVPFQVKLANHCAFFAKHGQKCIGISIFEPRDLTPELGARLQKRIKTSKEDGIEFFFQVPDFVRHRLDIILPEDIRKMLTVEISPFMEISVTSGALTFRSKIRIINVDDSPVILKLLKHLIEEIPYLDLIDQSSDPLTASALILAQKPDIVTMDIQMPGKTGVDVVREVLSSTYIPILMVSSLNLEEGSLVFEALRSGAFDYLQKPKMEEKADFSKSLLERLIHGAVSERPNSPALKRPASPSKAHHPIKFEEKTIWCLGSSTGGTQALTQIFTSLPAEIPPTLVVQHIPPIFSKSFAQSLNELVPFEVKEAIPDELLKMNTVYIAPGGLQASLEITAEGPRIRITDAPPVNRFKPSVDFLFESMAKIKDHQIVAGILTGMGKDGANGLLKLRKSGAFTFCQDEATSTVYGMPRAAFEIGAAQKVVGLNDIAETLIQGKRQMKKVS